MLTIKEILLIALLWALMIAGLMAVGSELWGAATWLVHRALS